MLNILCALRVWGKHWLRQKIKIYCDNLAVVQILNTGKARHAEMAAIARNIFMLASRSDIQLVVVHIPGKSNVIADLLSRWQTVSNAKEKLEAIIEPVWAKIPTGVLDVDYKI